VDAAGNSRLETVRGEEREEERRERGRGRGRCRDRRGSKEGTTGEVVLITVSPSPTHGGCHSASQPLLLGARDMLTSSVIDGASTLRPSINYPGYSPASI
jgi:hypothetical protein